MDLKSEGLVQMCTLNEYEKIPSLVIQVFQPLNAFELLKPTEHTPRMHLGFDCSLLGFIAVNSKNTNSTRHPLEPMISKYERALHTSIPMRQMLLHPH